MKKELLMNYYKVYKLRTDFIFKSIKFSRISASTYFKQDKKIVHVLLSLLA